ncbi:MAG: hypothetical protein WC989_05035 [Micavibrio sp.]
MRGYDYMLLSGQIAAAELEGRQIVGFSLFSQNYRKESAIGVSGKTACSSNAGLWDVSIGGVETHSAAEDAVRKRAHQRL